MVTYAELAAEPWWGREIVTPELDWLGDTLCTRLARPRGAAGSKGDNKHLAGAHRSQEWILASRYATSRTYTVQTGLTDVQARHIAGFDMVPGPWGSTTNLRLMIEHTGRLLDACRSGRLPEVRELYGTLDGRTVVGWRNGRPATSDDSHLEHWHLSLDRRECDNRALMERIVAIVFGEDGEDMPTVDEIAAAVAPAVWNMTSKEYVDADADGERQQRTRVDVLHRAEAAAQNAEAGVAELRAELVTVNATLQEILSRLPAPPVDPPVEP
jgi:hypothetical protein